MPDDNSPITKADLKAILEAALEAQDTRFGAALKALDESLSARLSAALEAQDTRFGAALEALDASLSARFRANLDAAVHSIALDFSDLRGELTRRMEAIERRVELHTPLLIGMQSSLAGVTRGIDGLITDHAQRKAADAVIDQQFRAIIQRIEALERQRPPLA
jgi:hypothetical protein